MRKIQEYQISRVKRRLVLGQPVSGQYLTANGIDWNGGYLPALMSLNYVATSATAVNAFTFGIGPANAAVNDVGLGFPVGKTFVGTEAFINVQCGATAGTYTVDMIAVDAVQTQTVLITVTGTANQWLRGTAKNIASGIYALAGASSVRIGWKNRATSPGALANVAQAVHLTGLFL
jgi:hypothetical protein